MGEAFEMGFDTPLRTMEGNLPDNQSKYSEKKFPSPQMKQYQILLPEGSYEMRKFY